MKRIILFALLAAFASLLTALCWAGEAAPVMAPDVFFGTRFWGTKPGDIQPVSLNESPFAAFEYRETGLKTDSGLITPWKALETTDGAGLVSQPPAAWFSNGQLLELLGKVESAGGRLLSAGTLDNRARRFFSFEVKGMESVTMGGKDTKPYLTLTDSLDQTFLLYFGLSLICVVCANTYRAFVREQKSNAKGKRERFSARIKHTKNAHIAFARLSELLDSWFQSVEDTKAIVDTMAGVRVSSEDARNIFAALISRPAFRQSKSPDLTFAIDLSPEAWLQETPNGLSTRAQHTIDRMLALWKDTAIGNKGETLEDVFSATTRFYSYESSGGDNKDKQYLSSEFGNGADNKEEFLRLLGEPRNIEPLVKAGQAVWGLSNRIAAARDTARLTVT